MRVAHVLPDLGPAGGGVSRFVLRLAAAQVASSQGVHVYAAGDDAGEAAGASCTWHNYPRLPPHRLGRSPALRVALRYADVDVMHAHALWMRPLHYATLASEHRKIPLVISPHGALTPWALRRSAIKKQLAARLVHPRAFQRAAGWHVASELERRDLVRLGFGQPVCVAPPGIALPEASACVAARDYYDARAPQLRGQRVLLFYSRLHGKKRVRELVEVFAGLAAQHPRWHLLIVGIPETETVMGLRRQADHRGLRARVTVLDGSDAPAPYPLAELFVLPTHSENFGLVVLEALSHGVPIVTTTGTPWADLESVGAGACVELEALSRALGEWMSRDGVALRHAGALGRDWARQHFDGPTSARRLVSFYAELSSRR